MKRPTCPICGGEAYEVKTRFGFRHSCCGLWSWDGAPLVDERTHEARKAAHAAFDPLWRKHGLSRSQAYKMLSARLGIPRRDCHMKLMDADTAVRVPKIVQTIIDELNPPVIE